jgi:hypothetical protein
MNSREFISLFSHSQRRAIFVTTGIAVAGIAILLFLLKPALARCLALQKEINDLSAQSDQIRKDILQTREIRDSVQALSLARAKYLKDAELVPMFGASYDVRAKGLLAQSAQIARLEIIAAKESPAIPLQLPKPVPGQLYNRQPVEFTCVGSYAQLCEFVQAVEASFPDVILSGLLVKSRPQSPLRHDITITFEWPAAAEKQAEPPAKGAKK